ncbi:MAG: hypothetical protein IJZ42_01490 [Lachnospiraceae bacterium]|nr:hypothetical protein [Lachnospiraceae bacterium]
MVRSEALSWLAGVPYHGVRVIAPEDAVEAVRAYYSNVGRCITDIRLALNSKQTAKKQIYNS